MYNIPRMDHQQNQGIALTWAPERKRSRRGPKEAWRRTVERERQKMGFAIQTEAVTAARQWESRMEETSQKWPYSPEGSKELSIK